MINAHIVRKVYQIVCLGRGLHSPSGSISVEPAIETADLRVVSFETERFGSTFDMRSVSRGFDSRPPHCRVATLGKSFTRA